MKGSAGASGFSRSDRSGGLADALIAMPAPSSETPVSMESLLRFATSVVSLQRMLSVPATTPREAALHAEMRRTLGALSATLDEAARVEASRRRAALFRVASTVAAQLAIPASIAATRRDH